MESITIHIGSLALAGIVVAAGLIKAIHFWQFTATVRTWGFTSPASARLAARAIVAAELSVGALAIGTTVSGHGERQGMMLLAGLLVALLVGQIMILLLRREATCGCFGRPSRLGPASVVRTGALAVIGAVVLGASGMPTLAIARQDAPSWAYPSDTRTGIASVDAAIAAVTGGDTTALRAALEFTDVPCSTSPGLGGFPCPEGTPDGTVLPFIRGGNCELVGVPEGDVGELVANATRSGLFLHSVARTGATGGSPVPAPTYLAIFGTSDDPGTAGGSTGYSPVVLGITDAGVVEVSGRCAESVADAAAIPGLEFVLAPKSSGEASATPTPVVPPTGSGTTLGSSPEGSSAGWQMAALFGVAAATAGTLLMARTRRRR